MKQYYILLYTESNMEKLKTLSDSRVKSTDLRVKRFLHQEIDWNQRIVMILGQRGTGKTTLMLQRMKEFGDNAIYLSLDNIYFEANRLINLIDTLYETGFRNFYLDEVHRYLYWSKDLKNAYDNYPDIKIVVTGSSILEVSKGSEDLSRRALVYHLPGLSYREFLVIEHHIELNPLKLEALLHSHHEISSDLYDLINVPKTFKDYLRHGYYPFFQEGLKGYHQKLQSITNLILDTDVAPFEELTYTTIRNMKKLMYVISQSVPFKPNITELAQKLDIPRNSILKILDILDRAGLLSLLRSDSQGISFLQKPEKIYLQNTNLIYLLSGDKPETGNIRETFFLNQLEVNHKVTSSKWADFMVDDTYTFEVGGASKTRKQIQGVPDAYIAADDIKGGSGNKIPLFLFGLMY